MEIQLNFSMSESKKLKLKIIRAKTKFMTNFDTVQLEKLK